MIIGIAALNNEHIQIIISLTNALNDDAMIACLSQTLMCRKFGTAVEH